MKTLDAKKLHCKGRFIKSIAAGLGLAAALLPANVKAATFLYFDVNGTAAGYGTANGGIYSWDSTNWTTTAGGGAATGSYQAGAFPLFLGSGNYTVTVANSESLAGMWLDNTTATLTINGTGSGNLNVVAGTQGFLTDGATSTLIINAPITGSGEIEHENGGSLFLTGTNTYSGGTLYGTTSGLNVNNNSSFGTGPVFWGVSSQILVDTNANGFPMATGPLVFPNAMSTVAGDQLIVVGSTVGPMTFNGPWTNGAGGVSRVTLSTATTTLGIGGTIYGSGVLLKDGLGRLLLSGIANSSQSVTVVATNGLVEVTTGGQFGGTLEITNTAGQLQVDAATGLTVSNTLVINNVSNNAINLNFSGTDIIYALNLNGTQEGPGTYGAPGSGAQNVSSVFTGSGILGISAAPHIVQQPIPALTRFAGQSASFSGSATGTPNPTYQWDFNASPLIGQTQTTITLSPLLTNQSGTYTLVASNSSGPATSTAAVLTVLPTNLYTATILSNNPIAYWRLDETSGTIAYDDVSTNNGAYINVTLGQPGFSATDPDTCIGLPTSASSDGYVSVPNGANFNFTAAPFSSPFTLEAWALFTNTTGVERIISAIGPSTGWGWGIKGANTLRFTQGAVQDADLVLPNGMSISTGIWYYFALTYDGSSYNYYLNGNYVGSVAPSGPGNSVTGILAIGCDPPVYSGGPEQVQGNIDEVAIYNTALSSTTIMGDYSARYGTLAPPIVSAPAVSPATNYVSLSAEFQAVAAGQDLSYQWYKSPSTLLNGATASTLTLANLSLGSAGSYYVQVSNVLGTSNSPATALTVLPIPTNASQLDLTNGLVLHMPFNGNLNDISGHNNNGTAVGSISYVTPAAVGTSALHYSTDPTIPSYNYVTLGVVSNLQFGATTNFTVSMWVQEIPSAGTQTNLPFFSDETNSTDGTLGFSFAPYQGPAGNSPGGWQWSLNTVSSPNAFTSFNDMNIIDDGNWHNLVFTANRTGNLTTYVDGQFADSQAINFLGSIDTGSPDNIGQDATGAYAVAGQGNINDLAVWNTLLTPLQISGLYLGGASNGISFAPAIVGPTYVSLSFQKLGGQWELTWPSGNLQSSTNLAGGSGSFTNVPGSSSPYIIPGGQSPIYYRLHP